MPQTHDPHHIETKEIADRATGAAMADPDKANIDASNVFGEEVEYGTRDMPWNDLSSSQRYERELSEKREKERTQKVRKEQGDFEAYQRWRQDVRSGGRLANFPINYKHPYNR